MHPRPYRRRMIWCGALLVASFTAMLLVTYRGWTTRHRPDVIVGVWYLDDLRTDEVENSRVVFSSSGVFDGDIGFGSRWSYRDASIYFRTWRLNDDSELARKATNTLFYSWIADVDEFPLGVELSKDGKVMTLVADGNVPRCRLSRDPVAD